MSIEQVSQTLGLYGQQEESPARVPSSAGEEHGMVEVLEFCRAQGLEDRADVVGHWVWIKFDAKPEPDLRAALRAFGFRWSKRRGEWAHNCGYVSKRSKSAFHPRAKYGSVPVGRYSADDD